MVRKVYGGETAATGACNLFEWQISSANSVIGI
jgi:hypothetical protein